MISFFQLVKYLWFWLLLLVPLLNWGQQPTAIHLTEEEGLPDIEFYKIIEDQKGFIWLAADSGLYRYDGQDYFNIVHPDQRGNSVFGITEDQNGHIWYTNLAGQFFYAKGDKTTLFLDLNHILKGELADFYLTPEHIVVIDGRNIYRVNLVSKSIETSYNKQQPVGRPAVNDKGYVFTKNEWLIQSDIFFKPKDSLLLPIQHLIKKGEILGRISAVTNDFVSMIYFKKKNSYQFYVYDIENKSYTFIHSPEHLKDITINNLQVIDNSVWISTNQGLFIYDYLNLELILKQHLFKNINTSFVLKDSDENYWVSTLSNGIYVISNINVIQYTLPIDAKNVTKLKRLNDKELIFGTANGKVGVLNINNNQILFLNTNSSTKVTEIIKSHQNNQYLIAKDQSAYALQINETKKSLKKLKQYELNGAKALSTTFSNYYVMSSYKDAYLLDSTFKPFKALTQNRSYTNYYSQKQKTTYISTVSGLFQFDSLYHKKEITNNKQPIFSSHITESFDESIWLSSFKNGVYKIKNDSVVAHFTTDNGLLSNKISHIKAHKNKVWIVTELGVQCYDVNTKTFRNLTLQQGIPTYRISDIETIGDHIYFASNIGVFGINTKTVFKSLNNKSPYFTHLKIKNFNFPIKNNYDLSYQNNNIEIGFNANGFESGKHNSYQYRMLGLDSIWKTTKPLEKTITYSRLPGGQYTFQLKVNNQAATLQTIKFNIQKPFWNKWWFYIVLVLIVSILGYLIYTTQLKKLKRKQEQELQKEVIKKQLIWSQLENLRSQMNPHFIFNALNSIQEYIMLNERDLASSYLVKFSRLIRIYLDHSRESEVKLSEELKALKFYLELEKIRFEDELSFSLTHEDNMDIKHLKIPSLFIQPYVENAIKHGLLHKKNNREIKIHFSLNDAQQLIICEIIDNGIGIENSLKLNQNRQPYHKSFATGANKKRVSLLNEQRNTKIEVQIISPVNEAQEGTQVIIKIPISKQLNQ